MKAVVPSAPVSARCERRLMRRTPSRAWGVIPDLISFEYTHDALSGVQIHTVFNACERVELYLSSYGKHKPRSRHPQTTCTVG